MLSDLTKQAASLAVLRQAKARAGRRPLSVSTLLRKEKAGELYKSAAYGDSQPLWMSQDVGPIAYESKIPRTSHKSSPKAVSVASPPDDLNTGVAREDGLSNATIIDAGTTTSDSTVPDSGNFKGAACYAALDELQKLGAVSDTEAADTLQRLDAMDRNKLTMGQVGRYAGIGAVSGPAVGLLRDVIKKKNPFKDAPTFGLKVRHVLGDATAGALTSGLIPVARSALDRQAALGTLQDYVAQPTVEAPIKTAALGPLHGAHMEHLTDLAGLGAMAAGSASHLWGQQHSNTGEGSGPISNAGQAGLDLAGLGTMALPTVAALHQLHKGRAAGAGGGSKFVNYANLAGLGALGVTSLDKMQAHLRAAPGEDPEKKMLLGHGAHKALELGGYGALAGGTLANKDNTGVDKLMQLGGYGMLAAPQLTPIEGSARSASELAGIGMLAVPSLYGLHH